MVDGNTYEIHDYKTGNTLPTQEYLDKDRQLAIYAYGIKMMYPDAKKIRLIWHYLAFDKELCSERTEDALEKMRKEVLQSIHKIETCDEFLPKESALCQWCEFRPDCPNFKHLYSLEHKKDFLDDDGVILVNQYAKLSEEKSKNEEELENLRQRLVDYAKKNNLTAVFGSDLKARITSYQSLKFPNKNDPQRNRFLDTIKDVGLFEELASVDTYELAKMMNNNEMHSDIKKLIERFVRKEEVTRVTLSKK
jgi:putative RecB family exonuclease